VKNGGKLKHRAWWMQKAERTETGRGGRKKAGGGWRRGDRGTHETR
jgi:hypothetical protein